MKIIFLDIDGVLNIYCQERDKFGCKFHQPFVNNLRHIIEETNAKIVISSSWRSDGLSIMKQMWEYRGLPGEIINITPFSDDRIRGNEIQMYIDYYNIEDYCIIDDDNDMLPNQQERFVKTSENENHEDSLDIGYGLTRKCSEKVIKILNKI